MQIVQLICQTQRKFEECANKRKSIHIERPPRPNMVTNIQNRWKTLFSRNVSLSGKFGEQKWPNKFQMGQILTKLDVRLLCGSLHAYQAASGHFDHLKDPSIKVCHIVRSQGEQYATQMFKSAKFKDLSFDSLGQRASNYGQSLVQILEPRDEWCVS